MKSLFLVLFLSAVAVLCQPQQQQSHQEPPQQQSHQEPPQQQPPQQPRQQHRDANSEQQPPVPDSRDDVIAIEKKLQNATAALTKEKEKSAAFEKEVSELSDELQNSKKEKGDTKTLKARNEDLEKKLKDAMKEIDEARNTPSGGAGDDNVSLCTRTYHRALSLYAIVLDGSKFIIGVFYTKLPMNIQDFINKYIILAKGLYNTHVLQHFNMHVLPIYKNVIYPNINKIIKILFSNGSNFWNTFSSTIVGPAVKSFLSVYPKHTSLFPKNPSDQLFFLIGLCVMEYLFYTFVMKKVLMTACYIITCGQCCRKKKRKNGRRTSSSKSPARSNASDSGSKYTYTSNSIPTANRKKNK
eukprot:GHVL01018963.1.p1 GENE.GHVL01018963.1~~GHVL01018963.1.p1  ORF type:complete len:355 (-),score=68.40 GHVL01018963.1:787-1851(-)